MSTAETKKVYMEIGQQVSWEDFVNTQDHSDILEYYGSNCANLYLGMYGLNTYYRRYTIYVIKWCKGGKCRATSVMAASLIFEYIRDAHVIRIKN